VRDDYATGAMDAHAFDTSLFDPTGGQGTTPRPIRVRTGMDPTPTNGSAHGRIATPETEAQPGPFGPGSALPLADGTAPSPEFRVKAQDVIHGLPHGIVAVLRAP